MDPRKSFETPLLSSRTLKASTSTNAPATTGSSRLPLQRRPSLSGEQQPSTVGRQSLLRRPSSSTLGSSSHATPARASTSQSEHPPQPPATTTRLPVRRPSISGADQGRASAIPMPMTASRVPGTLKRTSSVAGLPQQQDSELSALKRQVARATAEADELRVQKEKLRVDAAARERALEAEVKEQATRIERLERDRRTLLAKERETTERDSAAVKALEQARADDGAQLKALRGELASLKDEHASLSSSHRELKHTASQAIEAGRSYEAQVRALKDELDRERETRHESEAQLAEVKDLKLAAEIQVEKLQSELRDSSTVDVVKEELHRQVATLRTLEKENGKLTRELQTYKNQHANVEVLKEAKKSLEGKLRGMDELRARCAAKEHEVDDLEREKREWLSFLDPSDAADISSPRKLSKTLAAARIENATLVERLGSKDADVHSRERMIGELEAHVRELETQLEGEKRRCASVEDKAVQVERRLELSAKEIDMLKASLASYASEEAMNKSSEGGGTSSTATVDAAKDERLAELEELLAAHKKEVAGLAKQVSHWRGLVERYGGSTTEIVSLEERQRREAEDDDDDDDGEKEEEDENSTKVIVRNSLAEQLRKNETLCDELARQRNENALQAKEIASLELQTERLERALGFGAYDPATTKVLEFKANPERVEHAVRTATLERLRDENADLLARLLRLEGSQRGACSSSAHEQEEVALVPRSSLVNSQAEVEHMRQVVAQKEVFEKRAQAAFAHKADELRRVVLSLLGFRLDFLSNGRVRVSSAYAPNRQQALLFSSEPGSSNVGTMTFLGADDESKIPDHIRRDIAFWVHERHSIPGLLASLTLTLFDESTHGRAAGFVVE